MNDRGATAREIAGAPASSLHACYLQPGELFVAREPSAVKTLLGSCVSVCLWDDIARVGGLNHFLLPHGTPGADRPGRYGNLAMSLLLEELQRLGAAQRRLTAKVFGGAAILAHPRPRHIGEQNVEVALVWLARTGIAVVGSDTGGPRGRKLEFRTDDGSVALWQL
jgi:chemotaxis protein CheD